MKYLLTACALATASTVLAQADLTAALDRLVALAPAEVRAGKDVYAQTVAYDAAAPYRLLVTQIEEDARSPEEVGAELNLGLVRRARYSSGRGDALYVTLAGAGTPFARMSDDGEPDGYEDEFGILAADVDNARAMEDALEEILPLAKAAYAAASAIPDDLPALQAYLSEAVGEVRDGDDVYEQSLTFGEAAAATLTTSSSGRRDERDVYEFRLGDLEAGRSEVDERGDAIELEVGAYRGADLIAHVEDDGDRGFEDELTLYFRDYESALRVSEALAKAVPLARELSDREAPSYSATATAVSDLAGLLASAKTAELTQELTGGCDAVLRVDESGRTAETHEFAFSFADLNARGLERDADDGLLTLEVPTAGEADLVAETEDGALDGYTDEVTFGFADARALERGERAIAYLAEACDAAAPTPSVGELASLLTDDRIGEDGEIEQEASFGEQGCKLELTVVERGRGDADETVSTFNLRDLNTRSGEIETRGTELTVVFESDRGGDLIQVLEDGEDQSYEDEVTFYARDLAAAKGVLRGIAAAAEGCGARR